MFSKILGKVKEEGAKFDKKHSELVDKISKMNLTDMRTYINNRISGFESNEEGLIEIMHRLTAIDATTQKRYIETGDMDTKIKKGFDLVLSIAAHKKITVVAIEKINEFVKLYEDIIKKYDTDHKEIYASRFADALSRAIANINEMSELKRKMSVLGE